MEGILLKSEPLWRHTTFAVGGPADHFAVPKDEEDLRNLLRETKKAGISVFVLGGGSNLLVADAGIRGLVIDTRQLNEYHLIEEDGDSTDATLVLGSGLDISDASWRSGTEGFKGLEFFFGMPGSVGGAVWMNARCYEGEISQKFLWADVMDFGGSVKRIYREDQDWDYKISPFQNNDGVILRAAFSLVKGDTEILRAFMTEKHNDREIKGHFRSPCAGSAFKNNRAFGSPSGALIDGCGLKGFRIGGATVSDWHGNIFINDRGATAEDIRELLDKVADKVEYSTGFRM